MEMEVMEIIREQHGEYEKERKQGSCNEYLCKMFKVHIYMLIEQMYVDFKLIFTSSPRKFGNTELRKNPEDLG